MSSGAPALTASPARTSNWETRPAAVAPIEDCACGRNVTRPGREITSVSRADPATSIVRNCFWAVWSRVGGGDAGFPPALSTAPGALGLSHPAASNKSPAESAGRQPRSRRRASKKLLLFNLLYAAGGLPG